MIYLLFTVVGVLLLLWFISLRQVVHQMSPAGLFLLAWGFICLMGGLDLVRYDDLRVAALGWMALHGAAFGLGVFLVPGRVFGTGGGGVRGAWGFPAGQLLMLVRVVCVLILIGYVARYLHITRVQGRVVMDVREAYMMNQELNYTTGQQGSVYSRIGLLLFLWPLPASVVAWHHARLGWGDRILFGIAGLGHVVYSSLQAGRSGFVFTLAFVVPLVLLKLYGDVDGEEAVRRRRQMLLAGSAAVLAAVTGLMIMFGIRVSSDAGSKNYSEVAELSPVLRDVIGFAGGPNVLSEGFAGALGYLTQPMQRLSLFTDLDIETRFWGTFNFDLAGQVLRKLGLGTGARDEATMDINMLYALVANAPVGTFSTCIRDYYLDFGWAGIVLGGLLTGHVSQRLYRNVVMQGRLEYLPLLGFMSAHVLMSPLFSGLQTAGANNSLVGAMLAFFVLRQFQLATVSVPRSRPQGTVSSMVVPATAAGRAG